jgi:hypothetical protein
MSVGTTWVPRYDDFFGYVGLRDPRLEETLRKLIESGKFDTDLLERAAEYAVQKWRNKNLPQILANYGLLQHARNDSATQAGEGMSWYIVGGHGFSGYREGFGSEYYDKTAPMEEMYRWDMETPVGIGIADKQNNALVQVDLWPSDGKKLSITRMYRGDGSQSFEPVLDEIEAAARVMGYDQIAMKVYRQPERRPRLDFEARVITNVLTQRGFAQNNVGNFYKAVQQLL